MSLRNYFKRRKSSSVAKDRLQIIIAQQRTENNTPDYLPMLREEILKLVMKYTNTDINNVKVDFQCSDNNSVLELNVQLPENVKMTV